MPDAAATGASVVVAAIVVASTVVVALVAGYTRPGSRCTHARVSVRGATAADDERASELTFGDVPLRRPDGANFTSLVPARAAAPSRAGALRHGNFGVHPDHPAVQALTAKTA